VVDSILSRENIERTGLLNAGFVLNAYNNYKKGALFYARQIWNVLVFLIWHRLYIESDRFLTMGAQPGTLEELFRS
jgi:hypothetical protein